jgi:hypothetical protein
MNSIDNQTQGAVKQEKITEQKVVRPPILEPTDKIIIAEERQEVKPEIAPPTSRKSFFDLSNYLGKIKEFLDNAE